MTTIDVRQIIAEVIQTSGITDPAVQKLVAEIATDSAQLATRSLAGETGLERETAHVKAQALNLSIYVRRQLESLIALRVTGLLVKALATVG